MEKSAAREACLPSFPTIPMPACKCQSHSCPKRSLASLTDIGSLDHTDIVSAIADTADSLFRVFPYKSRHVGFLGRRTSTRYDCRKLRSEDDEFASELIEAELRVHTH